MTPETYQLMTEYLARLYDVTLYSRHGVSYPIIHHASSVEQSRDIDSVIGHLTEEFSNKETFAFYNYAFLHSLQNSGRNLFNGTTYALKRLRTNPLRIDATLGTYFDMIATCIALEAELLEIIGNGMVRLPMRTQYHRSFDAQQSLTSGKGRAAALGAVALIVFNDGEQYQAIVSQRTGQHATRPNALHLIPAFMFQPMSPDSAADWRIKHHFYREYLEEMVGMVEGDSEMHNHPALHDLQQLEADGTAEIRLTGVTVNLLTLRVEISALMLIHDPTWWHSLQSGERGYQLQTPETQASLMTVPIASDEGILETLGTDYYLQMVPHAISAMWEGIEMARIAIEHYQQGNEI